MSTEVLLHLGQIAGVGGLALGVFVIVFRDVLRKNIFPELPAKDAFKIIRLVVILTFAIAAMGITAWVYVESVSAFNTRDQRFRKTDAEPAIRQYLDLVDANKFSEAWQVMARFAHDRYQPETFRKAYEAQRTPLGPVLSRTIRATAPVKQLADGTQGAFVMIEYVTKYQNSSAPFLEQVFTVAEDGTWKVFAHTNNPCPEQACRDVSVDPNVSKAGEARR
jgi:hypothetical protein